ncbi:DoxX-like family protein [Limibacter armeniacum]|uniref:DoxX-like family protein n=1 Tax=Limibacter armeniacum TaxID=466084 RepID=UPI002FE50D29
MRRTITFSIAAVWIANGLFCKMLNFVPRHKEIVAEILGHSHAPALTFMIGMAEVVMAVWILSGFKSKMNALIQMAVVLTMNIIEVTAVPHLLLWGRLNMLFALLFVLMVYINEFVLNREVTQNL